MNTNSRTMSKVSARARVVVAVIGAGVVVTMGALTVVLSGGEANGVTAHLSRGGDTVIQTTPPSVVNTPFARPPVKAQNGTASPGRGSSKRDPARGTALRGYKGWYKACDTCSDGAQPQHVSA